MLASIAGKIAETEIGLSVVTGYSGAKAKRQKFIEELLLATPVRISYPIREDPNTISF